MTETIGTRRDPATGSPVTIDMVAALLAVTYRRNGNERVVVTVRAAAGDATTATADIDPRTTFDDLLATVRIQAGPADADADAEIDLATGEVRVDGEPDAYLATQVERCRAAGRAAPDTPIDRLALVGPDDVAELRRLNGSGIPAEAARCVHEIVDGFARTDADRPAVRCGDEVLTYRGLVERARARAARLIADGVAPESVVAVLDRRSVDLVVSLLAVLYTGSAYLALDPDDPAERHQQLIELAGARHVVAGAAARDEAGRLTGVRVVVAADEPSTEAALPSVTPESLAYVSFTSGSTGEPKGVAVPHRGVARLLRGPDWVDIRPEDVFFEVAPVAFDASTIEIWGALLNGAQVVVYPAGAVILERVAALIRSARVSVLLLTTGLFDTMVTWHLDAFAGVRHVLTGGDVVSSRQVRRLMAAHPALTFTNGYGPTENTSFTTCWTSTEAPDGESVPIGPPIRGTRIAVLDEDMRPVPVGVIGELYAAGPGLARGYIGRPAETARRFVPEPDAPEPGSRMYRTGDMVRRRADGTIEFIGRVDQQVKVQGYRIELGAVEAEVLRLSGVAQAVVVAQAQRSGGKRLIGYVVAETGRDIDPAELTRALGERIPAYMVPSALVVRADLPLNRNGKVDRAALPAGTRVARPVDDEYVAPRTPLEHRIVELFGRILEVDPVGVRDDFFELGGHSLLAAELLGTLARELGVPVSARTLYLRPTVAELAEELGELIPR